MISLAPMLLKVAFICLAQASSIGGRAESLHSNFGQQVPTGPGLGNLSSPMPNASSWGGFGDASINAGTQSSLTAYDSPGLPGLTVSPLNQVVFLFSTRER